MMRSSILAAFIVTAVLSAADISWQTDAAKALAEAGKKNKLVMIDVYTDWCGWCKELDKKTYTDAKVIELAKEFVALKVNPEKGGRNADLLQRYKVDGFPTILFTDASGALIYVINGFAAPKEFSTKMNDVLTLQKRYLVLAAEYAKNDTKNAGEYLDMLVTRSDIAHALPIFEKLSRAGAMAKEKRGDFYLAFGSHYGEAKEYVKALPWFEKAEKEYPKSETGYQGAYFRALTLGFMQRIKESEALLSGYITDKATDKKWKERFENLLKEGPQR